MERTDWDIGKEMNRFFGNPSGPEEAVTTTEDDPEQDPEVEATTQVEGTADTDGASDGEHAEDVEDEEPVAPAEPFLTLVVEGEEIKVNTPDEARTLAQQGLHYSKKMNALHTEQERWAGEREQERTQLHQQVDQYKAALQTLSDVYGHVLGKDAPDWNSPEMQKLKTEKPNDYLAIREQWDQLGAIRSELSRIEQENRKESQKQWEGWLAEQKTALADKKPEWADVTRRQQDYSLIREYGTAQGLTDEEFANLYDHRFWMILHDAARYRQAQAAGKTKREAVKSKTVEPGSGKDVNQGERRMRSTRDRLKATGDVRAAGDILQEVMTRKR